MEDLAEVPGDNLSTTFLPRTVQDVLDHAEATKRTNPIYLKYFWKVLLIVAAFYGLPSMQFVIFQYMDEENHYQCYFNFKCADTRLGIFAFNNIVSNIGYVVFGALFLVLVLYTSPHEDSIHGLHTDMSLYYSMGLSVVLEGLFSSLYHVCPSKMNFQFDATFMLIGAGLLFITLYQKRHPTFSTGAFRAFGFFGTFVFLDFLSLTGTPPALFWSAVSLCFAYISWAGSAHLYVQRRVKFSKNSLKWVWNMLLNPADIRDKVRFYSLVFANMLSWVIIIGSAVDGVVSGVSRNFSTVTLGVIIVNFFMYLGYYLFMKRRSGENTRWYIWVLFVAMMILWVVAVFFFEIAVTNKFLTFQESMLLNKPCVLFHYFDYHDIWHFLSALGLVSVMLLVYLMDVDLHDVPRTEIAVF